MIYRRRATPLHAARAAASCAWCAALGVAALVVSDPVALLALLGALLAAGGLAGCQRELRGLLRFALGLGAAVLVVNALVVREGLTVLWRFGDLPVLGQTDLTLQALVAGAVLGLRAALLVLCGALYSLAVDPDEVLRLVRRVSYRSALSATLATRLVPVLARDSRRLADARRCRPGDPPSRLALLRATSAGALDRALDVAVTLELRGYAGARAARGPRRPLSRHDLGFALAAFAVLVLAIVGRASGQLSFSAAARLHIGVGPGAFAFAAGLLVAALAPFADRRGLA